MAGPLLTRERLEALLGQPFAPLKVSYRSSHGAKDSRSLLRTSKPRKLKEAGNRKTNTPQLEAAEPDRRIKKHQAYPSDRLRTIRPNSRQTRDGDNVGHCRCHCGDN